MHKACLILIGLILLSGCSKDDPESMMSDYMWRVANTLEADIDNDLSYLDPLPLFPARRDRILPVEEVRQGLLEVLDLKFCNILPLIAERNSSLGKVMLPSKQLAYELKFFAAIRDCKQRAENSKALDAEPELRQRIAEIYRVKRSNLHNTLWNGIYTAREVELQFTTTAEPLPLSAASGYAAASRSIGHLQLLSKALHDPEQWQLPPFLDSLESDYETLNSNRFGGQALRSLQLLTTTMERTSTAIESRLAGKPLCFKGHQTQKSTILNNVFQQHYARRFQPYLARVDRETRAWIASQQALLASFSPPPAMKSYIEKIYGEQNSLLSRYQQARKQHIKSWQALLTQCGMMPGSRRTD
ncbi:DUF3080 family protein [Marinobacterium jannaschii]|uniref:DUF3080 family protein n=1 Tax=Marinobacterium jannaschii TaxID=64970 RepID=UPI00048575D6|nr:DUF3080 family protein [Marinobacterium jannaschii]